MNTQIAYAEEGKLSQGSRWPSTTSPAVGPSNYYILQLVPEHRTNVRGHTPSRVSRYIWTHCFSPSAERPV